MPGKIFGIGLARTGTKSLSVALGILKLRSIHWPRSMKAIDEHEASCDSTVACRFRELDQLYPGSKFVLTIRDMESWLASVTRHFRRFTVPRPVPRNPAERFAEDADRVLYSRAAFSEPVDEAKFRNAYRRHTEDVFAYFEKRPDDLLTYNLVGGAGWEPLCNFLLRAVPPTPFPHLNQG